MRSLFIKLFLSFWLVMILTGAAFTLIFEATRPNQRVDRFRRITGMALQQFGTDAAERIRQEGPEVYAPLAEELERTTDIRAVLLLDERVFSLNGEPSGEVVQLARQALDAGVPVERMTSNGPIQAELVPVEGGGRAVIVGEQRFPPPWKRWVHPETLELRILVIAIFSGLASFWLARYLSRPIRELRRATHRLAAGDLGARVGPNLGRRRDEAADLGRDFDHMASRIEDLLGAQRRLLRDISHELRSPLARLNVALELSRQQAGDPAQGSLDRIERESERLNELVGQLLTISQLENQATPLDMKPLDLAALVDQIVKDADYEAQSCGRRVEMTDTQPVVVVGSEDLLRRAVENVVRNGIRFTPEGTAVEVSVARDHSREPPVARLVVRDHGPGIAPEALQEIFRPFYRMEDARDRASGGIGLGLAITDSSVKAHGGTVRASNRESGGLEVVLEIPLQAGTGPVPSRSS